MIEQYEKTGLDSPNSVVFNILSLSMNYVTDPESIKEFTGTVGRVLKLKTFEKDVQLKPMHFLFSLLLGMQDQENQVEPAIFYKKLQTYLDSVL